MLRLEEVELGAPGPGQVLMRNDAVAVNYRDILVRRGAHQVAALPSGIGLESAGIIEAIGGGVSDLAVGDRVACVAGPDGAYATQRLVPAARVVRLPAAIAARTAAAMMIRGMTARYLLHETYRVQPGDTILVHAAAGGVGLIVCQWAKHLGATVIGTVGSAAKAEIARPHGCDHPIVCTARTSSRGCASSPAARACRWSTTSIGRDDIRGFAPMPAPARHPRLVRRGVGRSRAGCAAPAGRARLGLRHPSEPARLHGDARRAPRHRRPPVRHGGERKDQDRDHAEYPLREAARAHTDMEARRTTGSIVLVV